MIFFIAALVVSMAIVGTLISTTQRFSDAIEERGAGMRDVLQTDVEVINDPVAMPYNASNNTLTIYIKNTGSTTLPFTNKTVLVMINGTYFENLTFVLPPGTQTWGPEIVLTVVVGDVTLPDADYRLKVVVKGGVSDTITFRIN